MRFFPNGPDIPDDLIALQEKGQTIFVCGAGVSRTVGLPLFHGLVEHIYRELREDWKLHTAEREGMQQGGALYGQYDRVLRCLERRLEASDLPQNKGMRERLRSAVRNALTPPENADLSNHLALLDLSRDAEGQTRLLTTNFDTLFERAWFERHPTRIVSHAGPAMPQPKVSGFVGVLHLHGRLADARVELGLDETDLVLTSAEFGEAYLRSGWASRYVYDVVRAYTVVLVGYNADDPPMRYLLEALEADRKRYPDLRQVYAFASCSTGNEDVQHALWEAKGVEPILYTPDHGDHSPLYQSLREWKRYSEDPTAWRRERLQKIFVKNPFALAEPEVQECVSLLHHGDASQLLEELSPEANWLPLLIGRRIFNSGLVQPGGWISKRINDPNMIRACATPVPFDKSTHWLVNHAIERERSSLTPVRLKAWRLILSAKRQSPVTDTNYDWYDEIKFIKQGEIGYNARQLVAEILRPRLSIEKPYGWRDEFTNSQPEVLYQLINIDFEPMAHPTPDEILQAWPKAIAHQVALFNILERTLVDSIEQADYAGFLEGRDRTSYDVPSVAVHQQNAHHSGFYPIVRCLADIWQYIAAQDRELARVLANKWTDLPYLLTHRLYLYALSSQNIFTAKETALAILGLNTKFFWISGGQVEIMRLLTSRWHEFSAEDRNAIEVRLQGGIPRNLFPAEAFENNEKWESINDSAVFKRLKRIASVGGELSASSHRLLNDISARHPMWQLSPDDRDDFQTWHESRSGPAGHPERLSNIDDNLLVQEAMRIQREGHFEEGDIWRLFCSADPGRALRGLRLAADAGQYDTDAWQTLIWVASEKGEQEFQFELATQLAIMPEPSLREILIAATSWLQKRGGILAAEVQPRSTWFFQLWDKFANLAYNNNGHDEIGNDDDLLTRAYNEPGGILAWALFETLLATKPKAGNGLGVDLTIRFDRIARARGRAGLLARVYLARVLSSLEFIDPTWTGENLVPLFSWDHPDAPTLWHEQANDNIGTSRLFNMLKPAMLKAFEREDLSDHELQNLIAKLLNVAIWHRQGYAHDYNLTSAELKKVLTTGPVSVRQNASWQFWRYMGDTDFHPTDKTERWTKIVGPLFHDIWPLDARLRTKEISQQLVFMALECENAFPDAVNAVIDFIVPYQLYSLSHSLRLERQHNQLVTQYPIPFLKLVNALIDPTIFSVPDDLAALLNECVSVNPLVVNEPSYVRLYGLRRQRGA